KVPMQWINPDLLNRGAAHPRIGSLPPTPLGLTNPLPVGRQIGRARKTVPLHKRFRQPDRVAVFALPIAPEPTHGATQDMTGQTGHPHPRQDEEARVINHLAQSVSPLSRCPAYELVAGDALPSGRSKEQTRHILSRTGLHQVLEIFTHDPQPQIMVLAQVLVKP